jgi:hypothetical protein
MKSVVSWAVILAAAISWAQEIGNEIPERQPVIGQPATQNTPNHHNPMATLGGKKSSASMSFGLISGFQGSVLPSVPVSAFGSGIVGPMSPTVGVKFFVLDSVALIFEVGGSFGINGSDLAVGFDAQVGVDVLFGSPENALRPLVHFNVGFGKPFMGNFDVWVIHGAVGGGGEYFFTPQLSLTARATVAVPLTLAGGNLGVLVTTLSPALLATFYFDAPTGMGTKH